MDDIIDFLMSVLPFVVLVVGIVATAASKTRKAKMQQGAKKTADSSAADDSHPFSADEKQDSASFMKNLKQTAMAKILGEGEKDEDKPDKPKFNSAAFRESQIQSRMTEGVSDVEGGGHSHSAEAPTVEGKPVDVKVEKVVVSGSAGGAITEGCAEHYYDRFVADDGEREVRTADYEQLRKYIVWKEILDVPKAKRKYTKL